MNIRSTLMTRLDSLWRKTIHAKSKIQITDLDEDSEVLTIDNVGITDLGMGAVILKTSDGKEFPISAFSVDVAKHISDFQEGKHSEIPSMYNMIEQICEESGLLLVKVRIYDNGEALRANLYFTGKKEMILRNHRASDAIALATFYSIPILIKKSLLQQSPQINSRR
ncbi:MAG TPA: bifunctional nuclease domain-containing protein [Nitrosarchaeum sp.]